MNYDKMKGMKKIILLIALLFIFSIIITGCTAGESTQEKQTAEPVTQSQPVEAPNFKLVSPAFEDGGEIPVQYCMKGVTGGKNISPPLGWTDPPEGTKSFAITCIDTHPIANNWVHWLVVNIPADVRKLPEGASPLDPPAVELKNSFGFPGWGGPQPPVGSGTHNYVFTIYALSVEKLDLTPKDTLEDFEKAIEGKVLAKTEFTGVFKR